METMSDIAIDFVTRKQITGNVPQTAKDTQRARFLFRLQDASGSWPIYVHSEAAVIRVANSEIAKPFLCVHLQVSVCMYGCICMYGWEYGTYIYICYPHSCIYNQNIYVCIVPAIYTTSNPVLIFRLLIKASFYDMFIPFESIP